MAVESRSESVGEEVLAQAPSGVQEVGYCAPNQVNQMSPWNKLIGSEILGNLSKSAQAVASLA